MEKNIAILQKLYELTKSREKKWSPTNIIDQYAINIGKGKITIDYNRPSEIGIPNPFATDYDYRVIFYNENGTAVDKLEMNALNISKPEYKLLASLWKEVEDSYHGKQETIDSMLEELGIS